MLVFGYYSCHHLTSDHNCNVVGFTAKQRLLCGYTLETWPYSQGNHIVFRNRRAKTEEATTVT